MVWEVLLEGGGGPGYEIGTKTGFSFLVLFVFQGK